MLQLLLKFFSLVFLEQKVLNVNMEMLAWLPFQHNEQTIF